jgi:stress-induced morphogen
MIGEDELRNSVRRQFPTAIVEVWDVTGLGDRFEVRVASEVFVGKTLLEQHRMVMDALGDVLAGSVHAVAIKTIIPDE